MALSDSLNTLRVSALDFDAQIRTALAQAQTDIGIPEGSVVVPLSFLTDILAALEDLSEGGEAYVEGLADFETEVENAADAAADAAASAARDTVYSELRGLGSQEDAYVAGEANPYEEARDIRSSLEDAIARLQNGQAVEDRAIDSF